MQVDPYRGYCFKVEIQGVTAGHFVECSGLGIEVESIAYREGGDPQTVRQLPGRIRNSDVELRYGVTDSKDLYNWMKTVVNGVVERRNVTIVLYDMDGVTARSRTHLHNAWPKEWRAAELNSRASEVAIEKVVLAFESLNLE